MDRIWKLKEKISNRIWNKTRKLESIAEQMEEIYENAEKTKRYTDSEIQLMENKKYKERIQNDLVYSNLVGILRDSKLLREEIEERTNIRYQRKYSRNDLRSKQYDQDRIEKTIPAILEKFENRSLTEQEYTGLLTQDSKQMQEINFYMDNLASFLEKGDSFLLKMYDQVGELGSWAKPYLK